MQLFIVYYKVTVDRPFHFNTTEVKNDIPAIDGAQSFRWLKIAGLKEEDFTFPIDKFIIHKIKHEFR
jgi:hypothetical protein